MKKKQTVKPEHIDASWTLFLDRDGVINKQLMNDYVKDVVEFQFVEGAVSAIKQFKEIFYKVVVVTNQQGIGKGLMTENDLKKIHDHMLSVIRNDGGDIDKIYYCPDLKEKLPFCRKPQIGMALQARKDFPGIDFKKSIMAGDTLNDMVFGHRLGMTTVLINQNDQLANDFMELIDYHFESLFYFAKYLTHEQSN